MSSDGSGGEISEWRQLMSITVCDGQALTRLNEGFQLELLAKAAGDVVTVSGLLS